jgi:hypothetical protein
MHPHQVLCARRCCPTAVHATSRATRNIVPLAAVPLDAIDARRSTCRIHMWAPRRYRTPRLGGEAPGKLRGSFPGHYSLEAQRLRQW